MNDENKIKAVELLQNRAREIGRLPKKADFSKENVSFIRQMLGPWPRALEAAGLKEVSPVYLSRKDHARAKRIKKRSKGKI